MDNDHDQSSSVTSSQTASPIVTRNPSHGYLPRPKGILKNPSSDGSHAPMNLTWDEHNLQEAEENKDAKMKITEPKTPYVHYDAETDTVMDLDKIPSLELGVNEGRIQSSSGSERSGNSSRHSSFASSRSGSQPGSRRGSDSGEKKVDIVLDENLPGGGLSADASDEDESKMTEEERIKHAVFKNQRKHHYGSEGQALLAAKQLLAVDDEEAVDSQESEPFSHPPTNGHPPPVPQLANGHA